MSNTLLKAELIKKIQEWADENCESNWPDVIVHDDFTSDMADSAFAVFKSMVKSQKYCLQQGYLKNT